MFELMCQYVLSGVGVRSISWLAMGLFLCTCVVVSYLIDLTGQLPEVAGQSEVCGNEREVQHLRSRDFFL